MVPVNGETFRGKDIPLDGHRYDGCSFHNCTFVWLYVERFELPHTNWFYGDTRLRLGPETHDIVANMFQLFDHEALAAPLKRQIEDKIRERGGSLPG